MIERSMVMAGKGLVRSYRRVLLFATMLRNRETKTVYIYRFVIIPLETRAKNALSCRHIFLFDVIDDESMTLSSPTVSRYSKHHRDRDEDFSRSVYVRARKKNTRGPKYLWFKLGILLTSNPELHIQDALLFIPYLCIVYSSANPNPTFALERKSYFKRSKYHFASFPFNSIFEI